MADASQVEATARAVLAWLDYRSSPESRQAAASFLDSLKEGDVQVLGATASALVKERALSLEIRHYGFKLLQYLVRKRWEELTTENRAHVMEVVIGLIPEIATPNEDWVLKSQTAALVAEVVRHEGASVWEGLLCKLRDLATINSSYAELVVMVLRWLPEDITMYNEDLEGERRRQLLLLLTQALPLILPLFYKMLELYFHETVTLVQQNQLEVAKQHAAVVTATLNALLAYAEWAPVDSMASLINACGFLLNAVDFRLRAGEFLKQIASRRRPTDESASTYDCALRHVFEVLSHASRAIQQGASNGNNENELGFSECLCEAMVALGSHNLHCLAGCQDHLTLYLEQMLGFLQHEKVTIHYPALLFWLAVLRETPPDPGMILGNGTIQAELGIIRPTEKDKKGVSLLISDEVYSRILELAFHWFLKKSYKAQHSDDPTKIDEDLSSVVDYSNYRGRLLDLVRLVALQRPVVAVIRISQNVKDNCGSIIGLQNNSAVLESSQRLLDVIIHTIFDGESICLTTILPSLQTHLEGLLNTLLFAKSNEPIAVEIHGRLLDAIGPFLRNSPAATLSVVKKMFELLISIPIIPKGIGKDSVAIESSRARLQVCTSFLRIAMAADKAVSAHMEVIWRTVCELQEQGLLQQGEHNLIAEAFLVAASAAGRECQAQVLEWFLKPLQDRWGQNNWQNQYLLSPGNLVELLNRETKDGLQNEEMWSIFHSLTFFERVLKRCASQDPDWYHRGPIAMGTISLSHPMMSHLIWIIPHLLQLIRCIHAFWSPSFKPLVPSTVQGALMLSTAEQAYLIGEAGPKVSKSNFCSPNDIETNEGATFGSNGKESEIRNWLKGIRESSYNIIGLAATHFSEPFFGSIDSDAVQVAFVENLEAMEFRHIRYLLHSVIIPLVKSCPLAQRDLWLGKMLPRLLVHCEASLSMSWTNLIRDGAVNISDGALKDESLGLKAELIEERMLRDLSRETCALMAVLASPALNPNFPPIDQVVQLPRMELSGEHSFSLLGSECMMRFVMEHQEIVKASLSICMKALKWPDSEAVHKALVFCGATVTVAAISSNAQLQNFIATDLFTAIIDALTIESNAPAQAELVSLVRIIYLLTAHQNAAPRQVLQLSPSITEEVLSAFEKALNSTSSAKEQKQYVRSLLLQAGGNNLKALLASKSTTPITNVKNRTRGPSQPAQSEEADHIGLATIM